MTNLDELIAFNDEVVALSRAGIPIDLGLSQLSHDPEIAMEQIEAALTRRVQGGVSLIDAVQAEDDFLPPMYRGVVSVGLRCGRLPAALEALGGNAQALLELRQSARSALVYPAIICALAYFLFAGSCWYVVPEYYRVFEEMGKGGGAVFRTVQTLRDLLPFWVAIPPLLLTVPLIFRFRSNTSRGVLFTNAAKLVSCLPVVSRITRDHALANLAALLALLAEHEVPLHEGLRLVARASCDRKLTDDARRLAADLRAGQSLMQDADAAESLPPFLRWAVTSSADAFGLSGPLRLAAQTYRHRAERRANCLRVVMPMVTCVVLAGGITLLYCLSVFVPLVRLIRDLT
jgi:type II secretory pathway component PulF